MLARESQREAADGGQHEKERGQGKGAWRAAIRGRSTDTQHVHTLVTQQKLHKERQQT